MNKPTTILCILFLCTLISCSHNKKEDYSKQKRHKTKINNNVIVDCHYTFEEAVAGTKAPKSVIEQLQLIDVQYYSTDKMIHSGQILTNKLIANDLKQIFRFMLQQQFQIAKAIPIVNYNWNDNLSMKDNNTSSFCYRNTEYSKHALGMAIDINPYFNPLRWKNGYKYRSNKPEGAIYDSTINGTLYPLHPIVQQFTKLHFRWGHNFTRNYDDQHFQR
jgi:hypothetical protein